MILNIDNLISNSITRIKKWRKQIMKRVTNVLTIAMLVLSMIFTPMKMTAAQAAAKCKCNVATERIKREFPESGNVRILFTDTMLFVGQYQVKNKKDWEKELKEKKAVFLFQYEKAKVTTLIVLKCEQCATLYVVPVPSKVSSENSEDTGKTDTSTPTEPLPPTGNTGDDSSSSGNKPSGGDSTEERPKPEEPTQPSKPVEPSKPTDPTQPEGPKKYDTSGWKFSNTTFTYDGKTCRPTLVGVPAEVEVIWDTEGEINAGNYSANVSFKVPEGYQSVPNMETHFVINKATYEGTLNFDKTSFSYDGKSHAPSIENLPEGAKVINTSAGHTSAGKYTHDMEIEISPNYENVKLSTEYEITPSKLSLQQQYNPVTGKVDSIIEGLVDEDLKELIYTVNGSESSEAPEILEPGRYEIKTELFLDESKKQNYTGTESEELQTALEKVYEAKRKNAWYKLSMDSAVKDGKLTINIFLSDIKVQTQEEMGYVLFTLGFNVKYDQTVMQYDSFEAEADDMGNGFDGAYNPDRGPSGEADERDAVLSFFADSITDTLKVCTLVYDIDPAAEDVSISLEDFVLATGEEDNPFEYTTDNNTVVVNPSEDYIAPEEILIDWDPMKDSSYVGDDDEEAAARENLQDYIDEKFSTAAGAEAVANLPKVAEETTVSTTTTGSAIIEKGDHFGEGSR